MEHEEKREIDGGSDGYVRGTSAQAAEPQQAYRLNGMMANENDRGIIIQNGKKIMK